MPERVIIHNTQSPGDFIVLSAALRDISRMYPGRYQFVISVLENSIYQNNPHVVFGPKHGLRQVVAKYNGGPYGIHKANQNRAHFMWGFLGHLNQDLGTGAILTEFKPDLHLTDEEKSNPPLRLNRPYWVICAGGKKDYTAKWWDPACWQEVVNRLNSRVDLVQVGGGSHIHPKMAGVHDLVGKTGFRELMRLIYHSHGVLCVVTCHMHIAAAFNKPCVVVSGGREPWWWEAYTKENRLVNMRLGQPSWNPPAADDFIPHRFLHTIGELDCCKTGGCWKARVEGSGSVCTKVVSQNGRKLPKCLQMITPEMVAANVQWYYDEKILSMTGGQMVSLPPASDAAPLPAPSVASKAIVLSVPVPVQSPVSWLCAYVEAGPGAEAYVATLSATKGATRFLAVCNGVNEGLRKFCAERKLELLDDETAPGRSMMLRKTLTKTCEGWLAWCEEPVTFKSEEWLDRLFERMRNTNAQAAGPVYWTYLDNGQEELLRSAAWFKNSNGDSHPLTGRRRVYYPARGFLLAPAQLLLDLQWPDARVHERDLDVLLGAALAQVGCSLTDSGPWVEAL